MVRVSRLLSAGKSFGFLVTQLSAYRLCGVPCPCLVTLLLNGGDTVGVSPELETVLAR